MNLDWKRHPVLNFFKTLFLETIAHDCPGLASEMAFSLMVSLVPGVICFVSLAGLFGQVHQLLPTWMDWLNELAPQQAVGLLQSTVQAAMEGSSKGLAIIGFLGSLIPATNAAQVLIKALLRASNLERVQHKFFYQPVFAVVIVLCLGGMIFGASNLILFGGAITRHLHDSLHITLKAVLLINVLKWLILTMGITVVTCILFILVNRTNGIQAHWRSALLGAVVFMALWVVLSLGFGFYIHNFNKFNPVYGSLWGVVLLLTWLYLSALSLLIGGEVSAIIGRTPEEIERIEGGNVKLSPAPAQTVING